MPARHKHTRLPVRVQHALCARLSDGHDALYHRHRRIYEKSEQPAAVQRLRQLRKSVPAEYTHPQRAQKSGEAFGAAALAFGPGTRAAYPYKVKLAEKIPSQRGLRRDCPITEY